MLLSYIVYSSLHFCVDQVNTRVYSSLHLGNLNIKILQLHFYLISIRVTKSNTMSGSMNNVIVEGDPSLNRSGEVHMYMHYVHQLLESHKLF